MFDDDCLNIEEATPRCNLVKIHETSQGKQGLLKNKGYLKKGPKLSFNVIKMNSSKLPNFIPVPDPLDDYEQIDAGEEDDS